MKPSFFLSMITVLCVVTFATTGCFEDDKTADQSEKTVTEEELLHRNFVLTHIDGEEFATNFPPPMTPNIEFGEGFRVSGVTCNRFLGQAKLHDGVLSVTQMVGTRMHCPDPRLNQLESIFTQMMQEGTKARLVDQELTLRHGGHILAYQLKDHVR